MLQYCNIVTATILQYGHIFNISCTLNQQQQPVRSAVDGLKSAEPSLSAFQSRACGRLRVLQYHVRTHVRTHVPWYHWYHGTMVRTTLVHVYRTYVPWYHGGRVRPRDHGVRTLLARTLHGTLASEDSSSVLAPARAHGSTFVWRNHKQSNSPPTVELARTAAMMWERACMWELPPIIPDRCG